MRRGYTRKQKAANLFTTWRNAGHNMRVDAATALELSGIEIDTPDISLAALAVRTVLKEK